MKKWLQVFELCYTNDTSKGIIIIFQDKFKLIQFLTENLFLKIKIILQKLFLLDF